MKASKAVGLYIIACLVLVFSPLMFVISRMLDYFEDCCSLSGHAWETDGEVYMRPVRQCTKCLQVQVKLPRLEGVSEGGWINHNAKKTGHNCVG